MEKNEMEKAPVDEEKKFDEVAIELISISPNRQRTQIETLDLEEDIRLRGLLQPIIIKRDMTLIAGERRLTACRNLGHSTISVRYFDTLSEIEAKLVEYAENAKRKALTWQDEAKAILEIHELLAGSQEESAKTLGVSPPTITRNVTVAKHLSDPNISKLDSLMGAFNLLQRKKNRKAEDAIMTLVEVTKETFEEEEEVELEGEELSLDEDFSASAPVPEPKPAPKIEPVPKPSAITPAEASLLNKDFREWAPRYSGPKFNFLHCDFPYGVNVFGGKSSGRETHHTYEDSKETYWELLECLAENADRIISPSSHIMFWLSMEYYVETLDFFARKLPMFLIQKKPLTWLKTDNVGIIPDPKRTARGICETAIFGSAEDRFIVKPVGNGYPGPTQRDLHPSTKPEPMLHHFFQMFVDENTRLLDPTCGSGSSLRAAEKLGAELVIGLEMDEEIATNAQKALHSFRLLRKAVK